MNEELNNNLEEENNSFDSAAASDKPSGHEAPACHCGKKKLRSDSEKKALINRLSRIEGQIRGIKGMVERDGYCPDILIQAAAVTSALNSFNKELLDAHIRTCVADDIRSGNDETIDELTTLIKRLMK